MSLREDIAAYFSILEPAREKRADEIINKVLDAAAEAFASRLQDRALYLNGKKVYSLNDINEGLEAINKLRGK